jgi:DNA recombination protein RmuC
VTTGELLAVGIAAVAAGGAGFALALALRRRGPEPGAADLAARLDGLDRSLARVEGALRDELARGRSESLAQLVKFSQLLEVGQQGLRASLEESLRRLQDDNSRKLDQMRQTVDEKLQGTLEKRLGESFRQVSERLELVHRGLGEMRDLATGVGDLKRVLTNVKTRGTWGEVQLGLLLEQVLTPEQYAANVATRPGSAERVEFAVRLPGPEGAEESCVWLPVDAKFPKEDYERLVAAQEAADAAGAEEAQRRLEERIRRSAKDIREKYICVPQTTDFAILFVPVEGLYAEVIRRPGLVEVLQREYRVVVAGPTTFAALLNSLQMGFRTLAIQKRSGEIWKLLGVVKTEFGKFGEILEGVRRKLQQATDTLDDAARKSRTIERRLRDVQALPAGEAAALEGEAVDEEPAARLAPGERAS